MHACSSIICIIIHYSGLFVPFVMTGFGAWAARVSSVPNASYSSTKNATNVSAWHVMSTRFGIWPKNWNRLLPFAKEPWEETFFVMAMERQLYKKLWVSRSHSGKCCQFLVHYKIQILHQF